MNQEINSEKNPLDELFARKLGQLERPPAVDSFARLQQRMQGGQQQPRIVFWRNPSVQIAAAACVAAVVVAGWLYRGHQSGDPLMDRGASVAGREQLERPGKTDAEQSFQNQVPGNETVAQQLETDKSGQDKGIDEQISTAYPADKRTPSRFRQQPQVAGGQSVDATGKPAKETVNRVIKPLVAPELVAAVPAPSATQKPATERVLIVTIEEPEALVAARQTAVSVVNNMPVLAASPSREGKATFWQQVKRLKQEDDVARQEAATDESGLVIRAYKGIKQRLEKDKPAKQ